MTKYDFTTLPNRLTHHTYKWKETETDPEIIPAWIADMDFNVIPEVREAVIGYADQMVYGYTYASDSLYQSILDWEKNEHGYSFDKEAELAISLHGAIAQGEYENKSENRISMYQSSYGT